MAAKVWALQRSDRQKTHHAVSLDEVREGNKAPQSRERASSDHRYGIALLRLA
jgi:hypothetical protein